MRRSRPRPVPTGATVTAAAAWRFVTSTALVCYLAAMRAPVDATVYLNQWAVQIDGGARVANAVAAEYGFRNLGQVRFTHARARMPERHRGAIYRVGQNRLGRTRPWSHLVTL